MDLSEKKEKEIYRNIEKRFQKQYPEYIKKKREEEKNLEKMCVKLIRALSFYADPKTYFAVSFIYDPPSGFIYTDFSKTELGMKPGKRARKVLADLEKML